MTRGTALARWVARQDRHPLAWLSFFALSYAVQVSPRWIPTPDSVAYLSVARSLARGAGLQLYANPQIGVAPGYALLIAPLFWIDERPFLALHLLQLALACALMLGVHVWLRRRFEGAAVLLTGVVMANVSLWMAHRRLLSELAFTTFLVWAAVALDRACRARRDPGEGGRAAVWALAGGACLLAATATREVGVVFAAGFALACWRRGRGAWLPLAVGLPAIAAAAAFVAHDASAKLRSPAPVGTHLDALVHLPSPVPAQLLEGLRLRVSDVGRLLVPGMFRSYGGPGEWLDVNLLVYVPLALVVALGWTRLTRRHAGVLELGAPFYLAVYLIWPFGGDARYLLPILPLLVACVWQVVGDRRGAALLLLLALAAHAAVAVGQWLARDVPLARSCDAHGRDVDRIAALVGAEPAAGGTVGTPVWVGSMLSFRLDRAVRPLVPGAPVPPAVRWVVVPAGAPAPPGFGASARGEHLDLHRAENGR